MFFIGIFSSHIPYILLAIIYLACLPALILEKGDDTVTDLFADSKILIVDEGIQSATISTDCYLYVDYSISDFHADSNTTKESIVESDTYLIIRQYISCFYNSILYHYTLFSRPPPPSYMA